MKRASRVGVSGEQLTQLPETSDLRGAQNSLKTDGKASTDGQSDGVDSEWNCNEDGWMPAVVPGTVLTSLVANGVFPDPLHGSNTRDCIPDIAHAGRPFYTFLFRRCLHLPSRKVPAVRCCRALLHCQESGLSVAAAGGDKGCCSQGDCSGCERVEWERVWLCFRGVNYSLSAFLNGRQLSIDQPAGMFLRRQLDITDLARRADSGRGHCGSKSCSSECSSNGCSMSESRNHLAVVVNPVDHPGNVDGGGQGGDHQVQPRACHGLCDACHGLCDACHVTHAIGRMPLDACHWTHANYLFHTIWHATGHALCGDVFLGCMWSGVEWSGVEWSGVELS
ncbi:unnamed protein product [Closterium sp. NIES-53]